MEFRQLRYFVALAQELHFGRAASGLYITQQALSKQIRELEDKLDVKLFERGHGFCKLTAAGEVFLVEVKRLLFEADEAITKTRRVARGEIGQIKIAITGSRITIDGEQTIIARQIKKGKETLVLRDEAGVPLWRGWRNFNR